MHVDANVMSEADVCSCQLASLFASRSQVVLHLRDMLPGCPGGDRQPANIFCVCSSSVHAFMTLCWGHSTHGVQRPQPEGFLMYTARYCKACLRMVKLSHAAGLA